MPLIDYKRDDIDFLIGQFRGIPQSRKTEKVSEFCERFRRVPAEMSQFHGKYSMDLYPYFREIADCLMPYSPIWLTVLMKGVQIGGTENTIHNAILYNIAASPAPQAYYTSTDKLMRKAIARIDRMIDASGVRHLIYSQVHRNKKSRGSGDTDKEKEYPGGAGK